MKVDNLKHSFILRPILTKKWQILYYKLSFVVFFPKTSGNFFSQNGKKITQQKNHGPKFLGVGCVTYGPWGLEMLL
jgi:hypothetical protein